MVTLEAVLDAALALTDDERGELILILRDTLGDRAWTTEEVEAAWLAAVIDGEGSNGLYDYGREGRRIQIQLGNTHEGFVARFR